MSIKDGGPAFPAERFEVVQITSDETRWERVEYSGMTLRDYFAGQALVGLLSGDIESLHLEAKASGEPSIRKFVTAVSYTYADAMLAEREADDD
jgi:hypothetical protein